jgi:hypothetical protein
MAQARSSMHFPRSRRQPAVVEAVESRLMLSAVHPAAKHAPKPVKHHGPQASPGAANVPAATGSASPVGFYANTVRQAYGLGKAESGELTLGGVAAEGAGQTIAIIDAYANPNALADLQTFDAKMSLPDPPSFQELNETGGTTLPTNDVGGWSVEESLDVQWAHAMAPEANIILYACASSYDSDLDTAIKTAKATAGVSVISMSYDGTESSGETSDDSLFTTPSTHTGGVTFLGSSGDHGASGTDGAGYPAISPNVVAVGGTDLYVTSEGSGVYAYKSETGWSGSSGGPSVYESQPTYQDGITNAVAGTKRAAPDVSIDADPGTGVAIVDSEEFGTTDPWDPDLEGGTSLASPMWGGLIADADAARATEGLPSLYGASGTLTRLYKLPSTDFHDVTTGSNGEYSAGVGYDLVTGLGSPVANKLLGDLAGGDTVTGRAFVDANADGVYDGTDAPLAGKTVYLDLTDSGVQTAADPTTVTSSTGTYTFANTATDLVGGQSMAVRLATPAITGYVALPVTDTFTTGYDLTHTLNITYFPTAYATTTAGSTYALNETGTTMQVSVNGTVTDSAPLADVPSLTFSLTGTGDALTVDATGGNPIPAGGVTFTGPSAGAALTVVGTVGNDTIGVTSTAVTLGALPVNYAHVSTLTVNPNGGTDALSVTSGTPIVPGPAAGAGLLARTFSSLLVSSGATLTFATDAAHADRQVIVASALTDNGTLNLGGNDMVLKGGSLSAAVALATTGFAGGTWAGTGLASSAAAADTAHLTALAVVQNSVNGAALFTTFDGVSVATTDVLVKYTFYGDTNLDGVVNAADYTRVDAGFVLKSTGWVNGDFNYDGVIDGSDYTLMDNAFNMATGGL